MKLPHKGFTLPDFSGQTQTLFVCEGNPVAVLLTSRSGKRRTTSKTFRLAVDALAWCRATGAMMIYCPVAPSRN